MSAEKGPAERFLEKQRQDFLHGATDTWQSRLPTADIGPEGQWLRMGKEHRQHGQSLGPSPGAGQAAPKQTFGEAMAALGALAGGVGGFLLGGVAAGSGWHPLLALGLFTVLGLVVGVAVVFALESALRALVNGVRWRRARGQHTAELLARHWEAKFGIGILQELVKRMDQDGAAWIMDRKGNFILRLRDGARFFVGMPGDAGSELVQKRGPRGFTASDALHMALIHHSLGRTSIGLMHGSKKAKRLMWAGAKLTGLEVRDYTPDTKALKVYDEMKKLFEASR